MSQDFKLRFDEMKENNPTAKEEEGLRQDKYLASSHTRNIGFLWPDGKKMFLNYNYLVSGECSADNASITLTFTTHFVTLKGLRFDKLFGDLMEHIPRVLTCIETRYNALQDKDAAVINEINIVEK